MKSFKRKKNRPDFGKNFFSIVFSFIVIFLIVFLTISNLKIYQRRNHLRDQIEDKEREIIELSEKIKDIKVFEEDDSDNDYHLEKIVREQLLLKKEGEEVIFITLPEREKEETEEKEETNWLFSIKNMITNKIKIFLNR
jgi:cell division protein FtsB